MMTSGLAVGLGTHGTLRNSLQAHQLGLLPAPQLVFLILVPFIVYLIQSYHKHKINLVDLSQQSFHNQNDQRCWSHMRSTLNQMYIASSNKLSSCYRYGSIFNWFRNSWLHHLPCSSVWCDSIAANFWHSRTNWCNEPIRKLGNITTQKTSPLSESSIQPPLSALGVTFQ